MNGLGRSLGAVFCAATFWLLCEAAQVRADEPEAKERGSKPTMQNPAVTKEPAQKAKLTEEEREAKFEEIDQLWSAARTAAEEGQYSTAANLGEQVSQFVRELLGNDHESNISVRESIAAWRQSAEEWEPARQSWQEVIRLRTAAFGKDDYRVADAQRSLAEVDRWERLKPDERGQLRRADADNLRVVQLIGAAKYEKGIQTAREVLQTRESLLGPDHPDTATTLNNLAVLHANQGNYAEAEPFYQRALKIREKALGPNHPDTAFSLNELAVLYNRQGNYAAAEPLYQRVLKIREKALGSNHPDTAISLNNLALLYSQQANYSAAKPLFERALGIRENVLGSDHTDTATILNNLAILYDNQGNYTAAEPLYERVLKIREKALGPDHTDTAASLNNLAFLYCRRANYAVAEPLYLRALKIKEKAFGPDHLDTALSLNNLAGLYQEQGNYAAAEHLYQRALKIREKALGPDHPDTAASLNNLATLYEDQGNYAVAEPLYLRALKIKEKAFGPDHLDTALSLNNLASLYSRQANYAAAEPLVQRALKINEKALGLDHPTTATNLNNLAWLHQAQGSYAAAEHLYQRALKIREKALGPDHPDTALSLNNLAELHREQGNYATAEPLYQRALKIYEKVYGAEHPDTARIINNLAECYREQENYAAAEHLFERSLQIHEKALGPDHPSTAASLKNLAGLFWQKGQPAKSHDFIKRGLAIEVAHLERTAAIQTEQQQFLMTRQLSGTVGGWLTCTSQAAPLAAEVWQPVLGWKGLITARQQALRLAFQKDPLFIQFRQVSQQLSTVALAPPLPPADPNARAAWEQRAPELRAKWLAEKTALEAEHERLEKELARKSADFRQAQARQSITPADIIAALKKSERPTALVDLLVYWYTGRTSENEQNEQNERRVAAFVVRPDGNVHRVELGVYIPIQQQIKAWRESYGLPHSDSDPGAELRKRLWEPLLPHLDGIETVLISPDRELAQLPWGALPGAKAGTYLIEERSLAVIPTPQMLPELMQADPRTGPPASLLLAGDIDYGGDPGTPQDLVAQASRSAIGRLRDGKLFQFIALPAAQGELASIKDWREQADEKGSIKTLRRKTATESAFREQAPQHAWLHLITHGFFAPAEVSRATNARAEKPGDSTSRSTPAGPHPGLLSGLAFAGANVSPEPDKDDGILTALEVAALDLSQVDTVVMSACETGLGEVAGGEGLLGLQRAFQVAGARTVVASLWKVPDAATARLMQRFYENLWDKRMGKLEALREAQIWMLRDKGVRGILELKDKPADDQPLPPQFWAAFVLSGDWR